MRKTFIFILLSTIVASCKKKVDTCNFIRSGFYYLIYPDETNTNLMSPKPKDTAITSTVNDLQRMSIIFTQTNLTTGSMKWLIKNDSVFYTSAFNDQSSGRGGNTHTSILYNGKIMNPNYISGTYSISTIMFSPGQIETFVGYFTIKY